LRFEDKVVRDLAVRIRELRHRKGLSQERLAEHCGLHRTYLGGIELGLRNPSIRNVARIAKALEVSMNELFVKD
jgi:transcriptional regulator with XRE-family HTH domain